MVRRVQVGPRRQRGFSLIELMIVIVILVALAGIAIPLATGYLEKAHSGAAAANISSITSQVETYKVKHLFRGYPDHMDSLIQSNGSPWTGIPVAAAALVTPATLTPAQVQSLTAAGITTLKDSGSLVPGTNNVTSDTPTTADIVISSSTTLLTVTDPNTLALNVPNYDLTQWTYVLLGLGNGCDIVGTDMVEAPVHFDTIDPSLFYQHYGMIFAVPTAANTNASAATHLAAVVGIHDAGLSGLRDHLTEYNNTNK